MPSRPGGRRGGEQVHHRQEADAKGYKKVNLLLEDALKHPLGISGE